MNVHMKTRIIVVLKLWNHRGGKYHGIAKNEIAQNSRKGREKEPAISIGTQVHSRKLNGKLFGEFRVIYESYIAEKINKSHNVYDQQSYMMFVLNQMRHITM